MKGCAIITPQLAIVVAEGPAKAQKKYSKLMLQRIAWNAGRDEEDGEPERCDLPSSILCSTPITCMHQGTHMASAAACVRPVSYVS